MDRIPMLSRVLDIVQRIGIVVGVAMIVAMGLLMNIEVGTRTLFGFSTQISDEYAGYFFTAATMLCFLPALRDERFLRVEGLIGLAPPRLRATAEAFAALIGAGTCAVLADATYDLTAASISFGTRSLQASQTPLAIPQTVMPLCFAILSIAFLEWGWVRSRRLWLGQTVTETHHALD